MKKCLLFVALLVSQFNTSFAQCNPDLFTISRDTVCIDQLIQLKPSVNATSYHWGFCSADMSVTKPTGTNIGKTYDFKKTSAIDIVQDDDNNYYGFVLNYDTKEFLKLDFGSSLENKPGVTNMGSLTDVLPVFPSSVYPVRDPETKNWYVFVSGGEDTTNSSLARLDFGPHLASKAYPNIANFGNFMHALSGPRGVWVGYEGGYWWGYLLNKGDNNIVRLEFEKNISNTPLMFREGNPGGVLDAPADMEVKRECPDVDGSPYYFFVVNLGQTANKIARIDVGPSVASPSFVGNTISQAIGQIFDPTGISLIQDCGAWHAFITNSLSDELTRMDMPFLSGPYTLKDFGNVAGFSHPSGISRILRGNDAAGNDVVYAFVPNEFDHSLSKINVKPCLASSRASSDEKYPPTFSYNAAGTYNVYLAVDQGLATEQVDCKTIFVDTIPRISFHLDTAICQGDTVTLFVESILALSYNWGPNYHISDTTTNFARVWPDITTTYHVVLPFENGCIIDTAVKITVGRVMADAGPDRTISDGAQTILGGPNTTDIRTGIFTYLWTPSQFLDNSDIANPVATPPYDYTYYLNVYTQFAYNDTFHFRGVVLTDSVVYFSDTFTCHDIDTVVVNVGCNDFNIPNVFCPTSANPMTNHFGLLNNQIIKLNYFRIFDRWGKLVFETTDPTKKWDGKVENNVGAVGVYIWIMDGFCLNGRKLTRTGNVTLMR